MNKRIAIVIFILGLLFGLFVIGPCTVKADVWNVPDSVATFDEAYNLASDGDTILVADGEYTSEILLIDKKVSILSHFVLDANSDHIFNTVLNLSTMEEVRIRNDVNLIGLTINMGMVIVYGNYDPLNLPLYTIDVACKNIIVNGSQLYLQPNANIDVENCIFNLDRGYGNGFFVYGDVTNSSNRLEVYISVINCTIEGSFTMYNENDQLDEVNLIVLNTIMYGEQEDFYIEVGSPSVTYSHCNWDDEGNILSDSLFANDTTYALSDYSNCIGAGADSISVNPVFYAPTTDFLGNPRSNPNGSNPDIGAIEHELAVPKEIVNSIFDLNETPMEFALLQNYPNPFNPTTTIKFNVPEPSNVVIEVYNMLGQKVADVVNEKMSTGEHSIQFDATNLSSGSYIYTIKAGKYYDYKRMILIK